MAPWLFLCFWLVLLHVHFWNGSHVESQLWPWPLATTCLLSVRISSVLGPLHLALASLVCLSSLFWLALDYCHLESCGLGPGHPRLVLFLDWVYLSFCVKVSLLGVLDFHNLSCICWLVWRELIFCFWVYLVFVLIFWKINFYFLYMHIYLHHMHA